MECWHALATEDALTRLDSRPDGLSDAEAAQRLAEYGPNRLRPPRPTPALVILRDQFRSVVVLLLIAAAAVSLLLGDRVEAIAISVVILLNAALGFVVELRARRAMEALLQLDSSHATVIRDGQLRDISADELVPGDVVELNAGQRVAADARVLEETDLRTDEAALTGESLPVSKRAEAMPDAETALADRVTMVYKGTTVAAGTGRALVTATGSRTEVGRIGILAGSLRDEPTPLERRLDALGRRLVWVAVAVALVVAALGYFQGAPASLMFEMAIALAVAAVPEGLPAVATIALAIGLRRMARRQALVRRLPAVEALGSTTVVCTDKTRTLTSGDMSIVRIWTVGEEFDFGSDESEAVPPPVRTTLETAVRASRQQVTAESSNGEVAVVGDPVDRAMLDAGRRAGVDASGLNDPAPLKLIPFTSERKYMATFYAAGDDRIVAQVKGAPRRILEMSGSWRTAAGDEPLSTEERSRLAEVNSSLAARGLRVLALASGRVPEATQAALTDLTFLGFVGLMDPPAPGVKDAIARLRAAGMRTVMLTGDQQPTAEAIGRELGLLEPGDRGLDARALGTLTDDELREALPHVGTFSRISPEDKLAIVGALKERGEVVAMLGDGVNDAPALRKADVGVAMGVRGTDVAKEAAAIVLQDDRFATIAAAVEEGRVIFDNIRKFVFYLFSCNLAEILVLLVAGIFGWPLPLLPLQILWLNLVTDTFPALALAMEPGDRDVMARPPRDPQEAMLSWSFLASVTIHAGLITISTLVAFVWAMNRPEVDAATTAFMTLALAQIFHLGNARSPGAVVRIEAALSNRFAIGAVILCVILQLVAVYVTPLARVLRVSAIGAEQWLVIVGCASLTAIVGQVLRTRRAVTE